MKYQFTVKPQGTRMDGENLFGLTIINAQAAERYDLPKWMWSTQYDELTQYEVNDLIAVMEAGK